MINIKNQQADAVDIKNLEENTETILRVLGYEDYDIGISLVNLDEIQKFNRDFRNKDKPTDILSFPYHTELEAGEKIVPESDDDKNLGDIIICPKYVNNDLERWQKTFEERMQILLVHGICHLLGYDHIEDSDYEVMKKQEKYLLSQLN